MVWVVMRDLSQLLMNGSKQVRNFPLIDHVPELTHLVAREFFAIFKGTTAQREQECCRPEPGTWDETSTQEEEDTSEKESRYHHSKKILRTPCLSSRPYLESSFGPLSKNTIKPYMKSSTNLVSSSAYRNILSIISSCTFGGDTGK